MNAANNLIPECNPLGYYGLGEPPLPAALLWVALVHCYCVIVIGTLGNALAMWCVATCPKTRQPLKVLVFSVFLLIFIMCLTAQPVIGEGLIAHLTCDPDRISWTVYHIFTLMEFIFLAQIEQASIATIVVVRATVLWAPRRQMLGSGGAVGLLLMACFHPFLCMMGTVAVLAMRLAKTNEMIGIFVIRTLPSLITAAACIFMLFVIQRNKRRLAAYQQQQVRVPTTMDEATWTMPAVFISNLVFWVPICIYHPLAIPTAHLAVILDIISSTHLMVGPLVFMWFNIGYRDKIVSSIRKVIQSMSCTCKTPSVLQTGHSALHDRQEQKEDNNI